MKQSYEHWKQRVASFDPVAYRTLKEAYKAWGVLAQGYYTVRGAQDKEQNIAMHNALGALQKRIADHFPSNGIRALRHTLPKG